MLELPAPPPPFGPMLTHDDVGREAEALVRRYRLLAALDNRQDLRGAPRDPQLAAEMHRQLVSGVDMAFARIDAGWPIPPGVRLERLVYSPWLDDMELPTGAFRLPQTAVEFAEQFNQRTGIGLSHADQFQKVYRVTPLALGEVAIRVRDSEPAPCPTFRLLLSRHFDLIDPATMPDVLKEVPRSAKWFNRPALDGFRLLAEIEREALIGADLIRLARAGRPGEIRALLANATEEEMRKTLQASPDLRRLLAYALVQTDALAGFDTSTRLLGDTAAHHPASWFTAAAQGTLTGETGDVAAMLGARGSGFRQLLMEAFARPPDERMNPLNNEAATFYGFDNLLLSRLARASLGAEFAGGTRGTPLASRGSYDVLDDRSSLAQIILRHVDPVTADTIEQRSQGQQVSEDEESLLPLPNIQKRATGYAKYMLPAAGTLGSAPRFSAITWSERYADRRFWAMVLGHDRQLFVQLNLSHEEAAALNNALRRVRELFAPVLAGTDEVEVANRAICDLATGVSAISTNRRLGAALRQLLDTLGDMGITRPEDFRKARHRLAPGSEAFLKFRRKRGQPSADGAKRSGTTRRARHIARRKQAAATAAASHSETHNPVSGPDEDGTEKP